MALRCASRVARSHTGHHHRYQAIQIIHSTNWKIIFTTWIFAMDRRTEPTKMGKQRMAITMIMNSFDHRIGWTRYHHHHDKHQSHQLPMQEVRIDNPICNWNPTNFVLCSFLAYSPNKYTGTLGAHFDMDGVPFVLNPAISFDQTAQFDVSIKQIWTDKMNLNNISLFRCSCQNSILA